MPINFTDRIASVYRNDLNSDELSDGFWFTIFSLTDM